MVDFLQTIRDTHVSLGTESAVSAGRTKPQRLPTRVFGRTRLDTTNLLCHMIPDADPTTGELPPGVHDATWGEVVEGVVLIDLGSLP